MYGQFSIYAMRDQDASCGSISFGDNPLFTNKFVANVWNDLQDVWHDITDVKNNFFGNKQITDDLSQDQQTPIIGHTQGSSCVSSRLTSINQYIQSDQEEESDDTSLISSDDSSEITNASACDICGRCHKFLKYQNQYLDLANEKLVLDIQKQKVDMKNKRIQLAAIDQLSALDKQPLSPSEKQAVQQALLRIINQ